MKYKKLIHYNIPRHIHELTFSCYQKHAFFSDQTLCQWFIHSLERARTICQFNLLCYVIMPTHIHLIIHPRFAEYSISRILSSIKLPITRTISKNINGLDPKLTSLMKIGGNSYKDKLLFWQRGGGYDRNLTSPDAIRAAIEYIHANPVRKGLVQIPEAWRWSSAAYYAGDSDYPIRIDDEILEKLF